jgi:hypothetical protein
MSNVYSGGVEATALAAIKAAALARYTQQSDGSYVLNKESLKQWLLSEYQSMLTGAEAISYNYIGNIDVVGMVNALDAAIRPEAFASHPKWPMRNATTAAGLSAEQILPTVIEHLVRLKNLSDQVTYHWDRLPEIITPRVQAYFDAKVNDNYPSTTTRVVNSAAYIYTYVTDRGEESAPSAASELVDRDQNDTVTVYVNQPPAGRYVTHIRLYRSATGSGDNADWQMVPNPADAMGWPVASLPVVGGQYTIQDDVPTASLTDTCPSLTWDEPPADFRGAVSMGNGITVGYSGNTIIPSEPYAAWAYPTEYRKSTSHPIVGMVALDQLLVVGTHGPLKLLYGSSSDQLTEIVHTSGQSVVSARSMVAMSMGVVIFASPDGLCSVDSAGRVELLTANHFTREDWQALTPSSIFAAELEGSYIFHVPAGYCYLFNPRDGKLTKLAVTGSSFYSDRLTDTLYMASGTTLLALGAGSGRRTGQWKSKRMVLPKWSSFGWLQVRGEVDADAPAVVRLYRDGSLFYTATFQSTDPQRLPPGPGLEWEVDVQSQARIDEIVLAGNTAELQSV